MIGAGRSSSGDPLALVSIGDPNVTEAHLSGAGVAREPRVVPPLRILYGRSAAFDATDHLKIFLDQVMETVRPVWVRNDHSSVALRRMRCRPRGAARPRSVVSVAA